MIERRQVLKMSCSAGAFLALAGCVSAPPPPPRAPTLEHYQEAAVRAVNELLVHASIREFGRKPRIQLGQVDNRTQPYVRIQVEQVGGRIQEALLDSGQVTIFQPNSAGAAKMGRDRFINDDVAPTQAGKKDEPDYFLQGDFMSVKNNEGKDIVTFQLRLTDREQSMVWQRSIDVAISGAQVIR